MEQGKNRRFKGRNYKVGGRKYEVEYVTDSLFVEMVQSRGADAEGVKSFISYDESLIVIRQNLSTDCQEQLLLHELLHALLDDASLVDPEQVENFVSLLAPRLHALLRDNHELLMSVV